MSNCLHQYKAFGFDVKISKFSWVIFCLQMLSVKWPLFCMLPYTSLACNWLNTLDPGNQSWASLENMTQRPLRSGVAHPCFIPQMLFKISFFYQAELKLVPVCNFFTFRHVVVTRASREGSEDPGRGGHVSDRTESPGTLAEEELLQWRPSLLHGDPTKCDGHLQKSNLHPSSRRRAGGHRKPFNQKLLLIKCHMISWHFFFSLCLEILSGCQPHVGLRKSREMGGRSSGVWEDFMLFSDFGLSTLPISSI